MNKRGELTTSELIGIIILLASLAIIIFVYFQINWTGQVDDAVCHESVILRGTLPNIAEIKTVAPLKCKTDKICVRGDKLFGKGSCEEEYANSKQVSNKEVSEINDVNRLLSQEILSCWRMMGEGKISIFDSSFANQFGVGGVYSSCVICSRIAFDEESLNSVGVDLKDLNVDNYMRTHKAPNQEVSYYDYLAGENGNVAVEEDLTKIPGVITIGEKFQNEEEGLEVEKVEESSTDPNGELAVVFMEVSAPSHKVVWGNTLNALGIAWGGSFIINPARTSVVTLTQAPKLLANPITWIVSAVVLGAQHLNVGLNQNVAAGYCGDISYGEEAREGCSVVRLIRYDLDDLSQYCGRIESIS